MKLVKPYKNVLVRTSKVGGKSYWPTPMSDRDEWWEGGGRPRHYQWDVILTQMKKQNHGYPDSLISYEYNLMDIMSGSFILSSSSGNVFRIVSIKSKTNTTMECVVEDVFRINTFTTLSGLASPENNTTFLCFDVNDGFETEIDISRLPSTFDRWTTINVPTYLSKISFLKNPIFDCECQFNEGDVVALEKGEGFTTPTGNLNRKVVGRVVHDVGVPNQYVVEPITEHVEIFQNLGEVGDVLYLMDDGKTLTTDVTRKPLYLKTMDAVPNVSKSNPNVIDPKVEAGTKIEINGRVYSFPTESTMSDVVNVVNGSGDSLTAREVLPDFTIQNDDSELVNGIIGVMSIPTVITINGHSVTISTTDAGQSKYNTVVAIGQDIAKDINAANVPNVTARFDADSNYLYLTEHEGGDITITNVSGGTFASDTVKSDTGFKETNVSPKDKKLVEIIAETGEEIVIKELKKSFTLSTGIGGSDNGRRAMGIFYGGKVREGTNYVIDTVDDLSQMEPYIGDGVHILDSGNGEWVEMKYTATGWVTIATEDSARTDADTLSKTITHEDSGKVYIGTVSKNSRISNISLNVSESFDDSAMTINVGDDVSNDSLISDTFVDLLNTGTYTNTPSNVYMDETDLYVTVGTHESTKGVLKVVISYA